MQIALQVGLPEGLFAVLRGAAQIAALLEADLHNQGAILQATDLREANLREARPLIVCDNHPSHC